MCVYNKPIQLVETTNNFYSVATVVTNKLVILTTVFLQCSVILSLSYVTNNIVLLN